MTTIQVDFNLYAASNNCCWMGKQMKGHCSFTFGSGQSEKIKWNKTGLEKKERKTLARGSLAGRSVSVAQH
jgi:hypothetical protein